jgi:hypothetical protein
MDKIWSLFSGNTNILKFLLSPVRFTKCLGVRIPLRPPRKKALFQTITRCRVCFDVAAYEVTKQAG